MANEFLRRLLMYSPEVLDDTATSGTITLPTWELIARGGPPEHNVTDPYRESYARDIIGQGQDLGVLGRTLPGGVPGQYGSMYDAIGGLSMPSLNPNTVGTTTSIFLGPLAGLVANVATRAVRRFMPSLSFGEGTPRQNPSEYLNDSEHFNTKIEEMLNPPNSPVEPRSPTGGRLRPMGGYISRAGNVQGIMTGRENMFQTDTAPGSTLRDPLAKRMQTIQR